MPDNTPLYQKLQEHPTAPYTGFEWFVVGEAANRRAELMTLLSRMSSCNEPTCGRLIFGKNGNGKTLLQKSIQEEATRTNLAAKPPAFTILFSRVSLSQSGIPNIGVELAKNLRRSYVERAQITYTSIAAEILRRFSTTYKSPWYMRVLTAPAKIGLNYALKKYDEYIHDLIESAAEGNVDREFRRIGTWLNRFGLQKEFEKYARSQQMSGFLLAYIRGDASGYRSVEELNQALYQDLAGAFGRGQPQDIVQTLSSMARGVGCKVLVLQVDDCNEPAALDFLLPIVEYLESFYDPKVLLMVTDFSVSLFGGPTTQWNL